jgi:hypothetical protein
LLGVERGCSNQEGCREEEFPGREHGQIISPNRFNRVNDRTIG